MKKIKIKLPPVDVLKETPEQRRERIKQSGSSMVTKVVPNKKKLNKKRQRQTNKKEIENQL